jgi:oxalate decarboxylase
LNYCIAKKAKMTIYSNNARSDDFMINPGQLTFVPKGCWHDVENIGKEEVKFVIVYINEHPEDLDLSVSVGSLPTRVLNSIFGNDSPGSFEQLDNKLFPDVVMSAKSDELSNSSSSSNTSENDPQINVH